MTTPTLLLPCPVAFTPAAIQEINRLRTEAAQQGRFLRVGVKGGGCSGMTYVLDFDQPDANDERYEVEGIPVIMDKGHQIYLYHMQVDYSGGLNARGFVFNNPNATKTCGCGTSFAV